MKKFQNLNTYYKLIILILSTSILFFLLYAALYMYTSKQENQLYKATQKQYFSEVSSIWKLNSKTAISIINDVTFWDSLYNFTSTKDKAWYNFFIANQFGSYESDYVGIYDIKGQFIAKTSNSRIKTASFIPEQVFSKLHKTRFVQFYLRVPDGVVEVFGATIHPTEDPKKIKTKPSGYFFTAKLVGKDFCKILNNFSSSNVNLVNPSTVCAIDKNVLHVDVKLKDHNNAEVGILSFKRSFNLHFSNTKEILLTLMLASFINILIYLYYSKRWIYKPLKLVTDVLETENEVSIISLKSEPGEFSHIGHLFEENNYQRKQLELSKTKAEESDRLKSSFLANLSHEIRTPMNAIVGFSDLLNEPNLSEEVRNEYLSIIKNCGTNLVSIIEDLIEMSKIDSKQIVPNIVEVDLDASIKELYETMKVTIPQDKDVALHFFENKEPIGKKILTDSIKLKQILVNLISNAIKYTEKGKVVFGYQISEINSTIVFSVKDTGLGIDEKNLKFIFDRFRRIEDEFSVELSGLGLGLAISKAYVEMLGGTITVSSELKVGSVFTLTIPLKYNNLAQNNTPIKDEKVSEKSHGETILIAEDDNINFLLLQRILELKKYKVLRAKNGQEAVDMCRENATIDLVFMDIKMPFLSGFEAFKIINDFNPKLPVIAQTAYASIEDFDKITKAGFTSYVSKPLDKDKVFELLDSIFNN